MQICGVVAEFNPFHNGHQHLINAIKNNDDTIVVAVMSGNFVQRGEPAIISKFARAKAAVLCGVDLVLELPLPYSISTAMYFANGAIDILNSLGIVDTLCFGSENGDITPLTAAATLLNNPELKTELKKELSKGITFAAARQNAFEKISPSTNSDVLENPNDTLAIEYILAAERHSMNAQYMAVKRIGTGHDSSIKTDTVCSASELRKTPSLLDLKEPFMPKKSYEIFAEEILAKHYSSLYLLDRAMVAHLRTLTPEKLRLAPDISEGLENRILTAANNFSTMDEILSAVKSKRYTHARLRRILLSSYLGVTAELQKQAVPYIRVLGMNENGAKALSLASKRAKAPLIASLKEAEKISNTAAEFARLEVKAGDIYSLSLQRPVGGKTEYTNKLFKTF
ncbi:MAG: nucleotidyltransferase family protein [Ruminococcaceae bacterium]|nr:nucleotidyltransferase family protein [Oscillospiraceae bacterium]